MSGDPFGCVDPAQFRALDGALGEWALLAESPVSLDIMALLASRGRMAFGELSSRILGGERLKLEARWSNRLAFVASVLPNVPAGREFAEAMFTHNLDDLTAGHGKVAYLKNLIELRALLGDYPGAKEVVDSTRVKDVYHGYLTADVINPFTSGATDTAAWLKAFNRPFEENGLSPVRLRPGHTIPFNRLASTTDEQINDGPLVTVIQTVFNPEPDDLWAAANSILEQTWQNLELLMIDDCSPEMPEGLMEDLEASDPRVRVIRLPRNGGTYRARNSGLLAARGEFVTGMDSDDWSHPERIARQMQCMLSDPTAIGVDTRANRTSDELQRLSLGQGEDRRCEASLLVRRADALAIGGYLPARKAADSEFRLRLERWAGTPVTSLRLPLYMIRLSQGSLSRSDFRPGWSHQSRRAFYGSFSQWHADAGLAALNGHGTEGNDELPFSGGPARIVGTRPLDAEVDLCIVADWRGACDRFVDEVTTLAELTKVAVLHVDAPFTVPLDSRRLDSKLQSLINRGVVRRVYPDEWIDINTLLVRDPSLLQFVPNAFECMSVRSAVLVADGRDCGVLYDPDRAWEIADRFSGTAVWVQAGDVSIVPNLISASDMLEDHYPVVVRAERFSRSVLTDRRGRSVVGRLGSAMPMAWPGPGVFADVYPDEEHLQVRVLGETSGAQKVMKWSELPMNWLQCDARRVSRKDFWRTLTGVVHYGRSSESLRAEDVIEALVAGTPVITDQFAEGPLADCVINVSADKALRTARSLALRPADRLRAVERAQRLLRDGYAAARLVRFASRNLTLAKREKVVGGGYA